VYDLISDTLCITTPVLDKCVKSIMDGMFTNKNYRKQRKKCILRSLQTPRLLISTIHVKLKCSIGVAQYRNNVDIKIKLIRYDPNGVPNFFSWTVPPVYFRFCMTYTYLTFIDSKALFTSQTYILSNDPVNLELF
jgi:hypothetical protein